jgi:hypothetical protein
MPGHWAGGVTLEMRDGTVIPVGGAAMGDGGEDARYAALAAALRGRPVQFRSEAEEGCRAADVQGMARPVVAAP